MKKHLIPITVFIFINILNFILMNDYVIWRDVARPVLYINDSKTFLDLFHMIQYEGTPMLFHLTLWFISKITPLTPEIVKTFHLFIHIILSFVILFCIRIPIQFKLLLLIQIPQIVYLFYVRQYSWSIILILLFSYLTSIKKEKSIWTYIVLFLLTQLTIHSCLVAIVFFVFLFINNYINEKKLFHPYYLLLFLGVVFCYIQFIPPPDLIEGLKSWRPLFTLENFYFIKDFFWDILLDRIWSAIGLIIISYILLKSCFKEHKIFALNISFCILILIIGFYLIGCFKYSYNRHHWLVSYSIISFLIIIYNSLENKINWSKPLKYIFTVIFILSLFSYFNLANKYFISLFSNGKNAANYLDKYFPNKKIIGAVEFYMEPLIIYKKKEKTFYSLFRKKNVLYTVLNHESVDYTKYKNCFVKLKHSEIINALDNVPIQILESSPILVLTADEIIDDINIEQSFKVKNKNFNLQLLQKFNNAIFENYSLYLIRNN